jgi:hypothetical protein
MAPQISNQKTESKPIKASAMLPETKSSGLLISVKKINQLATREDMASDGGGTGRSDTNDK